MRCPFRYRRRSSYQAGVASDFIDYVDAIEDEEEAEYNRRYPTCWSRLMHWLKRSRERT